MNASNPAKQRRFTERQNHSATYHALNYVRPAILAQLGDSLETAEDGKPILPPALKFRSEQLGRVMSRANQMGRRVAEIERYVKKRARVLATGYNKYLPLALVMSDSEFQRWTFCVEASRRADESADRLLRSLREEMDHLRSAGTPDLVRRRWRLSPTRSSPSRKPLSLSTAQNPKADPVCVTEKSSPKFDVFAPPLIEPRALAMRYRSLRDGSPFGAPDCRY
jgi:hypothetical protein